MLAFPGGLEAASGPLAAELRDSGLAAHRHAGLPTGPADDSHAWNTAASRSRQDQVPLRVKESTRAPQVCLYVSEVGARDPKQLEAARLFVEERDWRLGQVFADDYGWSTCAARPGWGAVRREVRSGRADGVVVPMLSVISSHPGEVAEQLGWFEAHSAFIVATEAGGVVLPGGYVTGQGPLSPGHRAYRATPSPRNTAEGLGTCQVLAGVEWARYPLAGVLSVLELVNRAGELSERGPVASAVSVDADGTLAVSVSVSRLGTPLRGEAKVSEVAAVWLRELGGEIICRPQPDGAGDTLSVRLPLLLVERALLPVTSVSVSVEEA